MRMNHLTEITWANRDFKRVTFGKHCVSVDQIRTANELCYAIPVPIEGLFEQIKARILNPCLG